MALMRSYLNQTRDVAYRSLSALASFAPAAEIPEPALKKHASMHPEFWRVPPAANPSSRLLFWYARSAQDRRAANVLGFRGAHLRFSTGLPGRGFLAAIHLESRRDFPEKDLSDRSGPT